ncbi:Disease resistance protein [Nymphaea thermarum]|nr:Disease resistance protein [Nymphaea thermarum]
MLPHGYLTDPLLLQQLQCHGYGDPSENGTLVLRVLHEDMTNGRVLLETRHEALCGNSTYKGGVYGQCYKINFGRNDKINEAPRGKTIIMKVTAANNSDLTQVNVKLRTRSKFSGENMEPIISICRRKAFLSPSTSVQPSSPRKPEHEFSIMFNLREDEKLDVIEYSTGLDERMDNMKTQLDAECIDQMLLFGWTIEELIIFTLIFIDLNISWYEQGQGTGLPRQSTDKVFDNMKVLDLSYCKFLVKTPDFARTPHLEKLILDHCECLLEIGESIGQLKNLIQLSIVGCAKLSALPCGILQLNSLHLLSIEKCSGIKILPEESMTAVRLDTLKVLVLDACTSLKILPDYVGRFRSLHCLSLRDCRSLYRLPISITSLEILQELKLDNCTSLTEIPHYVGKLKSLRRLSLRGCHSLKRLPDSIGSLVVLQELNVAECIRLDRIPSLQKMRSLKVLYMNGCRRLDLSLIRSQLEVFFSSHNLISLLLSHRNPVLNQLMLRLTDFRQSGYIVPTKSGHTFWSFTNGSVLMREHDGPFEGLLWLGNTRR